MNIFFSQITLSHTTVHLESADGSNQNYSRWTKARCTTLDINEFFSTEVSTETGFSDCIVGIFESQFGS